MSIGQNIKKLRGIHDLTQKEFAKIAGVSDKAVSTWESEIKEPRMGAIQKIADYFGIQKSNIIEDNGIDLIFNSNNEKSGFVDLKNNTIVVDNETRDIIDCLRNSPEMKILFSASIKATKEDILKAVRIIEALRDDK